MAESAGVGWRFWRSGRFWLAGPLVFLTAVIVMAGGAVWMPKGAAGVDNIVMPLVLFPAIWAVLFFYGCLTTRIKRAAIVMGVLIATQVAAIGLSL